jgi:osmotically inducible protein OsmC
VAIDTEVHLGTTRGGLGLAARLNVSLPDMDQETAQSLVEAASHVCLYSLATSGNIDVKYNVITSEPAHRVRETQHA